MILKHFDRFAKRVRFTDISRENDIGNARETAVRIRLPHRNARLNLAKNQSPLHAKRLHTDIGRGDAALGDHKGRRNGEITHRH